ncbi:hypothetical protein Q5H91_15660 [Sphingomonas sp. KR1UV-12]|uniref:Uncharacterized protein n=1 Tax=Sphingomonas aurea TaxID=3063994 RepID=A0ABT9EPC1_9SPHN|nr:hypothetical protein [Sphingomonas sp. KR1UV-12]MDP1028657.1 hypothetical protein [Sphingomonas sp. KR1UV-12]
MTVKADRPYRTIRLTDKARVILTFWATAKEDKLHNIMCLDDDGSLRWRASLPRAAATRDCYVSLKQVGERLVAKTWSGLVVELCPNTGAHMAAA